MTTQGLLRRRGATTFEPTPQAAGPWHPDALFGGVPAGLAVHEVERLVGDSGWQAARITTDLVRPAPRSLLSVDARIVREGSRIVVAEATVSAMDGVVSRSSVLLVRDLGEPVEPVGSSEDGPANYEPTVVPLPHSSIFDVLEVRSGDLRANSKQGWARLTVPIVAGEPTTPLARTAVTVDLAAGMSNTQGEVVNFINADLSLFVDRMPSDEWLRIDLDTREHEGAVAIAGATLGDAAGPLGRAMMTSVRAANAVAMRAAS